MEIVKIIGVAFITAITSLLLKATKPELSFAVTITGVIVILFFIIDALQTSIALFSSVAQYTGVGNELLKVLLKIIGVGYITEFGAGILNDFGSNAMADKVVLCGKITIILLAFPVIQTLLELVNGFLKLA